MLPLVCIYSTDVLIYSQRRELFSFFGAEVVQNPLTEFDNSLAPSPILENAFFETGGAQSDCV